MGSIKLKLMMKALLFAGLLSACVDAPSESLAATEPNNNPLASSFDALSQDQLAANDIERSEEFRWAALALRAGVTPSPVQVTNNGASELYDGFVHAVTWASLTQAMRPPLHRSLVAWRRTGDVLQVLLVGMFTDSAPVLHPYSLRPASPGAPTASPVAGATAAYFERGLANTSWIGVGGVAKIAEHPPPSLCPSPNDATRPDGVSCQKTRFGVALNVLLTRTRSRDSRELDPAAPERRMIAPSQTVAGVKLLFSCVEPKSTGCD